MTEKKITNTRELRSFLVEQMIGVADGKLDAPKAKSICNIAQQIYNTLNVEVRAALVVAKVGEEGLKPLEFDRDAKADAGGRISRTDKPALASSRAKS